MRVASCIFLSVGLLGACNKGEDSAPRARPATTRASPTAVNVQATSQPKMRRVHVHISGVVQGVGFRAFTQREARKYDLTGYVLNLPDGRVEAVAEGNGDQIEQWLKQLRAGPPGSSVTDVKVTDERHAGTFNAFRIDD